MIRTVHQEIPMKLQLALVAGVMALGACSTTPPDQAAAGTKPTNVALPEGPPQAGTRFVNRSTDRSVRVIGNQDAKDDARDMRSIGNNVGMRSN
jgi:hypothetical protein